MTTTLVKFNAAMHALQEARTVDEVKRVRDKAEALRLYAKQSGESLEGQNQFAEIKLRAERRAGELLAEIERSNGGRPKKNLCQTDTSFQESIANAGIASKTAYRWQSIAALPIEPFDQFIAETNADKKELTETALLKLIKTLDKQDRQNGHDVENSPHEGERWQLKHGDFRQVTEELPNDSIDMIFTDPPYDEAHIQDYTDLAEIASRKLKTGGSLIAYAGHYALPQILSGMSKYLRYWWLLCVKHGGQSARLPGKWVIVEYKPLVWFVKGKRSNIDYVADFYQSTPTDKNLHEWQQDTSEASYYIEKLTSVGDLVADPFVGSGTTLVAALELNRRGWGCDIDEKYISISGERLSGLDN